MNASGFDELAQISSSKRGNLVTVQQPERIFGRRRAVQVVVDDTVGISIKRAHTFAGCSPSFFESSGKALVGLDVVGTTVVVECATGGSISAQGAESDAVFRKVLDEVGESMSTDTVGTVDDKGRNIRLGGNELEVSSGKFLIVTSRMARRTSRGCLGC